METGDRNAYTRGNRDFRSSASLLPVSVSCIRTFNPYSNKIMGLQLKDMIRETRWVSVLGNFVFPARCLKCGVFLDSGLRRDRSFEGVFCKSCLGGGAAIFQKPFCPRCGHLFEQGENHLCEACLKSKSAGKDIRQVRAALKYKGIVQDAVPAFKYRSRLSLSRIFEVFMFQAFEAYFKDDEPDLILPIPLHVRRLMKRGFNQAYVLVRHFPGLYQQQYNQFPAWKIDITSLKRVVHTRPQTGFDAGARKKNLKNAFQVTQKGKQQIQGKRILLVDDVYTTGSTCKEAAKTLYRGGADGVDVLVLARALKSSGH